MNKIIGLSSGLTRRRFMAASGAGILAGGIALRSRNAFAQSSATPPSGPPTGSVTFLSAENLAGKWNPYNHTLLSQIRLQVAAYDLLVTTDQDGNFVPGLAVGWSTPSPSVWEFNLREGVKFHDGTPFTARDVKASLELASEPSMALSLFYPRQLKCEVVNDLTVRIDTGEPYAPMLSLLASFQPVISAAHVIEAGKLDEKFMGTGPYKWVAYEGEEGGVKLTATEEYWGGPSHIKDYTFRFVGDSQTRLAALQSGQAQIIDRVEPDQIAIIEGDPNLKVDRVKTVESKWMIFRTKNAPMDNQKLRQAIAHAIDVPSIVKFILLDSGQVNTSMLTSAHYFHPGVSPTFPTYNPEKAKALLAEAGYPNGEGLRELLYYTSVGFYPKTREYGQLIVQNLADIGIKVNFQTLEVAKWNQLAFDPTAGDLWDQGCFIASRDPEIVTSIMFKDALFTGVTNPEVQKLFDSEVGIMKPEERGAYFRDTLLPAVETDLQVFPMFESEMVTGYSRSIHNFVMPPHVHFRFDTPWIG